MYFYTVKLEAAHKNIFRMGGEMSTAEKRAIEGRKHTEELLDKECEQILRHNMQYFVDHTLPKLMNEGRFEGEVPAFEHSYRVPLRENVFNKLVRERFPPNQPDGLTWKFVDARASEPYWAAHIQVYWGTWKQRNC